MGIDDLKPGQEISLTTNSAFYKNVYESKVVAVDKDMLCISMPCYKGLFIPLNVGFVLNLRINTGADILSFTSEILYRNVSEHSLFVRMPTHPNVTENQSSSKSCKFITVTSGKGGVGKTSFIINYAISLSKLGKKVVLLDADLGMANVDVLLKTNTRYNIVDVIDGQKGINEVIAEAPGGIHIIAGGSGIQKLANLSPAEYNRITCGFTYLESHYDYVLIDTGAGLSKNVTSFIFASDEPLVVTTPEPHAITDAYSIIKVILEENRDVSMKLIVNKCETPAEGTEVLKRITGVVKNFLNYSVEPLGYIPESRIVSRSIKDQAPFALSQPSSDVAKAIRELAEKEARDQRGNDARITGKGLTSFVSKFMNLFKNA
ncbi:MAG: AAA family ATPase [Clostridia bacterium]|nr:AAA family ATPase [Clostridia bacterium]